MIISDFRMGEVAENALKRSQMLAHHRFGLSIKDVMSLVDESLVAIAKRHFVTDKEGYYEPRAVLATTNGKFSSGDLQHDGTGFISSLTGHALTGTGTLFTTELTPGILIEVAGTIYTINTITDNLNATVVETVIGVIGGNFSYGDTVPSYDPVAGTITAFMNPVASIRDVGKVITFFDRANPAGRGFSAVISGYLTGPARYEITTFYPIVSLSRIANITVIDWLLGGDTIKLLQGNQIFSVENCVIFDVSNKTVIDIVPHEEFNRRLTMTKWLTGSTRWARYMQTQIDMTAGTSAPPRGTLQISAYWIPPRSTNLATYLHISNKRIPDVEDEVVRRLLSIKTGQPLQPRDERRTDLQELGVGDRQTIRDQSAVR